MTDRMTRAFWWMQATASAGLAVSVTVDTAHGKFNITDWLIVVAMALWLYVDRADRTKGLP